VIVVLRNRDTVDFGPPSGEAPDLIPTPQLPGTWTQIVQGHTGWVYLTDPDGDNFWWYTALDGSDFGYPTKIVGMVTATTPAGRAKLKAFALASDSAWSLKELRADVGVQATAIKTAWKMSRRNSAGDVIEAIAMSRTIAGFNYQQEAEDLNTVEDLP